MVMNKIVVTKHMIGICHMQVCAEKDSTDKEVLEVANRENPSGTSGGWAEVYREGSSCDDNCKPVVCADDPERIHLMLVC